MFGGIERIGRWFRWSLLFGDTLLFEGLFLFVPGTQLGSRLIEGKPDGDGDFRCHQHKKDQALPPEIAPTFLIAQFVEMRERMRCFRALVVRIVDEEAARGDAIVGRITRTLATKSSSQGILLWRNIHDKAASE